MVRARATTMEELAALQGNWLTREGRERGMAIQLRPSDVVIAPFGKSGTTWLQQIVHTLRTRGDMDFDDISRVIPWIETSTDLGLDLDAEQVANPRAFKSHLPWDLVPKGGRYLVSLREPGDVVVSMYHFMNGWFVEPGTIAIADFARARFEQRGRGQDYWAHLLSWWAHRDDDNVLLLTYEGMLRDPRSAIRRIAAFIGVPLDPELEELTLDHSSLAFMTEHKDRFDDFLMRRLSEEKLGLPPGSDSSKVRAGKAGARKVELPPEIEEELDRIWREEVTPVTGFDSYEELATALAGEAAPQER